MTRESALDLLLRNLEDLASEEYVAMVIDRAHFDKNVTVRKKIIQILSQILNLSQFSHVKS